MPTYDYRCTTTGEVLEVKHRISESISTWAELCELAGEDMGDTPPETPVEKILTGGHVVKSSALKNPEAPPCASGACGMGGGACNF
jgi:hypothetical protein